MLKIQAMILNISLIILYFKENIWTHIIISLWFLGVISSQSSRSVGERPQTGRDEKGGGRKGGRFVGAVQKVAVRRVPTSVGQWRWNRRPRSHLCKGQVGRHVVPKPMVGHQAPVGLLDGETGGSIGLHVTRGNA